MGFNRADIYTSSGSVMPYNAWTPYVSKYDTSSFYNWEQDNIPLYDLEERTYELWEQAGFPTSAVPGLSLTVSADTPTLTLQQNTTIFTDLSSCIAAIPKVVRFPVLIEVGNFGDLGTLELHNFRIEEGGSIEVINRQFGRSHSLSSTVATSWNTTNADLPRNFSHKMPKELTSAGLQDSIEKTKCVNIDATIFSATGAWDQRVAGYNMAVFPQHDDRQGAFAVGTDIDPSIATLPNFYLEPLERDEDLVVDSTYSTDDVSAIKQIDDSALLRDGLTGTPSFNVYFNTLDRISVKNCDGPVYIRNFFVDGDKARKVGIEINNSDVVLENCVSIRNLEAGFKFNNSKAVLTRSAGSYRNYGLNNNTTRVAQTGVGFHAINSELILSSLLTPNSSTAVGDLGASGHDAVFIASRNYEGVRLDNSKLHGGYRRDVVSNPATGGALVCELNTGYGLRGVNSHVDVKGLIDIYGNAKGIELDSCRMTYENLTVEKHSNEGVRLINSVMMFDSIAGPTQAGQAVRKQIEFFRNSQDLVLRKGSSFTFRRKNACDQVFGNSTFGRSHGVNKWNAQARALVPTISVEDGSTADLIHATIRPREAADSLDNVPCPGLAIRAVNSSTASMFGSKTGCTLLWGPIDYAKQRYVAGAYAGTNSTINFHGPTAMAQFGIDALAENNSVLNFSPPKVRDGWGYEVSGFSLNDVENHTSVELHSTRACLVANKNSVINMKDLGAYPGFWSNSTVGLGYVEAGNDLDLETFATSSMISNGSMQFFPNPQDSTIVTTNNLDDIATAISFTLPTFPTFTATTSANTFLVNDTVVKSTPSYTNRGNISYGGVCVRATEDSEINVQNVHFLHGNNNSTLDGLYFDGDSDLCHKLQIWNMADTSRLNAAFCSVSGTYPLDAAYHGPSAIYVSSDGVGGYKTAYGAPISTPDTGTLSVLDSFGAGSGVWVVPSGTAVNDPFDRHYVFSSTQFNNEMAQALGQVGINVSATDLPRHYGAPINTSRNKGIFRIYWGTDPATRYLAIDASGYTEGAAPHGGTFSGILGIAPQIFAQGYNLSAAASATLLTNGASPSGTYPQLLKYSFDSDNDGVHDQLWTSGFYYCREFVEDNPTQCILDESAANTFANSKNASVGSSGRPKKVTIIKSGQGTNAANIGSEAYPGDYNNLGGGNFFGTRGFKSSNIFDLERDN